MKTLAPSTRKVTPKVTATEYPPSKWVCPKCATHIRTHVPTYAVECRNIKHRNTLVIMEIAQ